MENSKNKTNTISGCALIDLEFTGLDNSIISDNEIIQVKILNASHADFSEMFLINALFEKMKEYEANSYIVQ